MINFNDRIMAILFVCPPFHALAVAFLLSRAFFHNLILLYEKNSFCQMRIIIYAPVFTPFFHIPSLLISFVVILFRCYTSALFISFFFSHTFEAESISQRKLWSEISSHFCFRFQIFRTPECFVFFSAQFYMNQGLTESSNWLWFIFCCTRSVNIKEERKKNLSTGIASCLKNRLN